MEGGRREEGGREGGREEGGRREEGREEGGRDNQRRVNHFLPFLDFKSLCTTGAGAS